MAAFKVAKKIIAVSECPRRHALAVSRSVGKLYGLDVAVANFAPYIKNIF